MASYRDAAGKLSVKRIGDAQYLAFVRDEHVENWRKRSAVLRCEPDFVGWHRLVFYDYDSRKLALEGAAGELFEADVTPVRRFLSDHNCKIDKPLRAYLDLEGDSRVPFALAIKGEQRLLSWAIVDENDRRISGVLDKDCDDAEVELWAELWKRMAAFDQLCAWNGDRYDFEVIKERSKVLARGRSRDFAAMWEHKQRLLFIDHMEVYKRHHMAPESGEEKTSLALGAVAQSLIGEGKEVVPPELAHIVKGRSMGASSWDLWRTGGKAREALVSYMIQDAALLPKIEAATGYLALQQTIAEVTHTFSNSHTVKPMAFTDAALLKLAHAAKTHLPSKTQPTGDEKTAIGAYVFECKIKGLARMVHVCDFKSLYPTIARTFNIGHETKGGVGCTAANGVTFSTETESMIASYFRTMMTLRDHWKKEKNSHTPGTPPWKDAHRMSHAFKIATNAGYGVFGCPWFRLYDRELVEAITLGGQLVNRATAKAAEERGWMPIAGDTDSLFIAGCTVEEFGEFVRWCNENLYPRLLDERNCRKDFRCIGLAYEKAFDLLVASQGISGAPCKKRYFGSYLHADGKPGLPVPKWGEAFDKKIHSRPEIRGLEFMRADSVRLARKLQEEAMWRILGGQTDPDVLEEWIRDVRTKFFNGHVDVADIAKSQSINRDDLDQYKTEGPHVRIAKQMKLRGEDVGSGTRISYIVVDGNVSPTKVISTAEYNGEFDRFWYWEAIYSPTLRVLAGAFPQRPWSRWLAKRPKPVLAGQLGLAGM